MNCIRRYLNLVIADIAESTSYVSRRATRKSIGRPPGA
jgi:hypothetical protein